MYEPPFPIPPMSYAEALDVLEGAKRLGIQPLLESVEDMLDELGSPDAALPGVQVAGTNGKTSTARYVAAILGGEGLRVALYTSPELVSMTERMEVDGRPVGKGEFALGVSAAQAAGERVNAGRVARGERPYDITQFDLLTVAALVVFARAGVDVCVLECGMGGRWDATSAARGIRAVAVTGIGLDHTRILGDTPELIAAEKAAIIRRGRACVLGAGTATPASVQDVFLERCRAEDVAPVLVRDAREQGGTRAGLPFLQAAYRVASRPSHADALALDVSTPQATYAGLMAYKPPYQAANIACAVALAESFLGRALDPLALAGSIRHCPTPGRFDLVRTTPPLLVDACHNPQGVGVFLSSLREAWPTTSARPALLVAILADKDVRGVVRLLAQEFDEVYVTRTASPRAMAPEDLAAAFSQVGRPVAGVFADTATALLALAGKPLVACGSITLAGEVAARFVAGRDGVVRETEP